MNLKKFRELYPKENRKKYKWQKAQTFGRAGFPNMPITFYSKKSIAIARKAGLDDMPF